MRSDDHQLPLYAHSRAVQDQSLSIGAWTQVLKGHSQGTQPSHRQTDRRQGLAKPIHGLWVNGLRTTQATCQVLRPSPQGQQDSHARSQGQGKVGRHRDGGTGL